MKYINFRRILKSARGWNAIKLWLLTAGYSHPRYANICKLLLQPFIRDAEIQIQYTCFGRKYKVGIRIDELESDYMSVMELAVRAAYRLPEDFVADFVLDGGGNIGLFTLYASAAYPSAQIVTCEPVPANIKQIRKHLEMNRVCSELYPICIGGSHRTTRFYIREANQGSFDSSKAYSGVMDIAVSPLKDMISKTAQRILIKLDIEGMEIEVLDSYLPEESRAVCIVGELHDHKANKQHIVNMFTKYGWGIRFDEESDAGSIFEAQSPAAIEAIHNLSVVAV